MALAAWVASPSWKSGETARAEVASRASFTAWQSDVSPSSSSSSCCQPDGKSSRTRLASCAMRSSAAASAGSSCVSRGEAASDSVVAVAVVAVSSSSSPAQPAKARTKTTRNIGARGRTLRPSILAFGRRNIIDRCSWWSRWPASSTGPAPTALSPARARASPHRRSSRRLSASMWLSGAEDRCRVAADRSRSRPRAPRGHADPVIPIGSINVPFGSLRREGARLGSPRHRDTGPLPRPDPSESHPQRRNSR